MRRIVGVSVLVFTALGTQALAVPNQTARQPIHFAGVQRAFQCFPGPTLPGERRPVGLSWNAAHGGGTPGSEFVYDIYMSPTSGAENFSKPNWTTEGHLRFQTPKLPPSRFFVVRARDRFGRQDHNRVELQAASPCV
jgi:hypothetical protein